MPIDLLPTTPAANAPRAEAEAGSFVLSGKHVLAAFVGFFVIVASVNGFMMFSAISTMPGLDAGRNGYDVSQRYNGEIIAAQQQAARGWRGEAELATSPAGTNATVVFTDKAGAGVAGLEVEMQLLHPTTRRLDHAVKLPNIAGGAYAARFPALSAGAWDVVITASRDGERLYQSRNRKQL